MRKVVEKRRTSGALAGWRGVGQHNVPASSRATSAACRSSALSTASRALEVPVPPPLRKSGWCQVAVLPGGDAARRGSHACNSDTAWHSAPEEVCFAA